MANREAATKEKELGNAAYKKKDFNSAISHYTKVSPRGFFYIRCARQIPKHFHFSSVAEPVHF